jgi:hypothetical protein
MKTCSLVCAGIIFGLGLTTLLPAATEAEPAKVPAALAKAKVDAAHRTYDVVRRNNREGLAPFAELSYRWSRRWLEAELDLNDNKESQLTAYVAHRDRMRELARITRDRYRNRVNTVEEASATDFYIAEAEIWIEQAKIK